MSQSLKSRNINVSTFLFQSHFFSYHIAKKASFFLDKEDEEMVVEDSFDGFKQMYQPILTEKFSDVMEIKDGKFLIDRKDPAT